MAAQRKYPEELRERAVKMLFDIRERDGKGHGELARVGRQLGVHPEAYLHRSGTATGLISVCGRLRACLKACSVPSLSRIGAGSCERAAGSWSAQRPRSGAAGVLDAAAWERIMGQPGQGGPRDGSAVRCSAAGAFLKGVREWPATCGPGLRRGGSQAYLGPRARAVPGDMMIDRVSPARRGMRPLSLCRPSACPARQGG